MADTPEPKFQVGALENPNPADPGFTDYAAALAAARALHNQINKSVMYPQATAIWSWPDGDCLTIIYGSELFTRQPAPLKSPQR